MPKNWLTEQLPDHENTVADVAVQDRYTAGVRDRYRAAGLDLTDPVVVEASVLAVTEVLTRMTQYASATGKKAHQDAVLEIGQEAAGELILALLATESVPVER